MVVQNNKKENLFKNQGAKIIVPLLILVVIGGIWFFKNTGKSPITEGSTTDFSLHVEEALDLEQLKSYGLPILLDFGADSCIPCKEMAPVLVKLNEELQGKAIIKFVDVWKDPQLAQGYPISVIPTQILIDKNGNPYNPSEQQSSGMKMYSTRDTNVHVFTAHEGGMTQQMILGVLKEMGLEK